MTRYLETGGVAFLGSYIAVALLARGERVRILDNFSTGSREKLQAELGAEVVEGDVRSHHLNAARDARVSRLVYASSSSIYGRNPALPKREDMMPQTMSPFAVSKLAGERD